MQNVDRRTSKPIDISPVDLNSIDVIAPNTQRATLGLNSAQRAPDDNRMPRSVARRAFSLVEILTVIGIIAILITLAVVGFKVVGKAAREKVTNNQLENAKGLLNEYELTSTIDTLPCATPATPLRWTSTVPASVQTTVLNSYATAQALIDPSTMAVNPNERYLRDETARAIAKLRSVPNNRSSLEKMSSDQIVKIKFPVDPTKTVSATTDPLVVEYATGTPTTDGVNLLDGWGHAIYFVPGGGLYNVNFGYDGKGDKTLQASYTQFHVTVKSPDGRPFWVSPGPDGDLTTGDDNVYSFGN